MKRAAAHSLGTAVLAVLMLLACVGMADAPSEYQVKAVFVYNFSHFVEWPAQSFSLTDQPFVIGIVGDDPFGSRLEEAIRGERINQHPLVVKRFRDWSEIGDCQILFIDRSLAGRLDQILAALDHRSVLTVSELAGAAERGVMIQFTMRDNHVRLRINPGSAHAVGLVISSQLLRLADIVQGEGN